MILLLVRGKAADRHGLRQGRWLRCHCHRLCQAAEATPTVYVGWC